VDARYDMTYFFLTVLCANVVGSTSGEGFLLCVHVVGCVVLILDAAADFGETKAPFTRYNLLSIRLWNRLDNRLYAAGCQTCCTTRFENWLNEQWLFVQRFDNRLDVCLHATAGCQSGCRPYNRFGKRLYRINGV